MPDEHEKACGDWRIPDELWERIVPLLPPRKPHPLGCHRPRVDDRQARQRQSVTGTNCLGADCGPHARPGAGERSSVAGIASLADQ